MLISGRPADTSGHIFLYALVIYDSFQIAVGNMLSESNTSNSIMMWLSEWLRVGGDTPDEFVCDMSPAILNAAVRVFTGLGSIREYNEACFRLCSLQNLASKECSHLGCYIRVDIAHLMKSISSWKSLQAVPSKVKEFYMRSIGLVIKSGTIEEAERYLHSMFVVAFSETEGMDVNNQPTPCEMEKTYLKDNFAGESTLNDLQSDAPDVIDDASASVAEVATDPEQESSESQIKDWIDKIKKNAFSTAQSNDNGDRDNLMHNEEIVR